MKRQPDDTSTLLAPLPENSDAVKIIWDIGRYMSGVGAYDVIYDGRISKNHQPGESGSKTCGQAPP